MKNIYIVPDVSIQVIKLSEMICSSQVGAYFQDLINGGNLPEENW